MFYSIINIMKYEKQLKKEVIMNEEKIKENGGKTGGHHNHKEHTHNPKDIHAKSSTHLEGKKTSHTNHNSHEHSGHKTHSSEGHSHAHHLKDFKKRFIISLILTLPILLLSPMIQSWFKFQITIPFQNYIILIFASIVYFYGGYPFLKGAVEEIKKKLPGMMTLISSAITVAFGYSILSLFIPGSKEFFWELATLIDIMLLGHWIEAKSVLGASRALEELVKIMPTIAHLIKDNETVDINISELRPNDIVLVKPGEKIPSDGIIFEGESYVNESLLTGESKPILKKKKDKVIGGSINGSGALKVKIEKTGEDTYLSQVIRLVKKAQESKSRTQDLANKAAAFLFYLSVIAGAITYVVWAIIKSSDFALERTVTVLVIACPHALGLAIPLVVAITTAVTARKGILVRDRRAFEMMKDIDAIVFDKTGTLTEGKFGITNIFSIDNENTLLSYASSLEQNSEHIIARSIVDYAKEKGIEPKQVSNFKAIHGKGVYGEIEGNKIYLGGENLIKELNLNSDDFTKDTKGKTVVYIVVNNKIYGYIAMADKIRESSKEAVKKLQEFGVKVFMLTGDSKSVASEVSKELGINDYFAEVLPHEKSKKIEELKKRGLKVVMVGDGINDAPALVVADVGIAIGAGTDVAVESADIVLVKNNPEAIIELIGISKRSFSKMVQNLWWAAGYNIVAIPLAAGVLAGLGIIINPAFGAVLMSLSTVIVAFNSQTLKKQLKKED